MSSSSEDAKKWKHRLRKKRERTAEVLAELKRVRHDVHAERRALADAAETIKLETISKAAAHRRAAEEHRADLERVRAQLRLALLDPVRAENAVSYTHLTLPTIYSV